MQSLAHFTLAELKESPHSEVTPSTWLWCLAREEERHRDRWNEKGNVSWAPLAPGDCSSHSPPDYAGGPQESVLFPLIRRCVVPRNDERKNLTMVIFTIDQLVLKPLICSFVQRGISYWDLLPLPCLLWLLMSNARKTTRDEREFLFRRSLVWPEFRTMGDLIFL